MVGSAAKPDLFPAVCYENLLFSTSLYVLVMFLTICIPTNLLGLFLLLLETMSKNDSFHINLDINNIYKQFITPSLRWLCVLTLLFQTAPPHCVDCLITD